MKNLFKTIIKDFHLSLPKNQVHPRDLAVPLNSGKIISLIGPRRCGKTYYFYHLINHLLDQVRRDQILYINFEDERIEITGDKMQIIMDSYYELYPDNLHKPIFLFFDEIQQIAHWEKFIRRMYDTVTKNIFITGSSARLLDHELATSLRGRHIVYRLYPLTFKENCRFQGVPISDLHSTAAKVMLLNHFSHYMQWGGYPEVVSMNSDLAQKTLQSYFNVMLFRDIIERYHVTNIVALRQFLKKIFNNIANPFSVNKFYHELKSQGIAVSKNDVYHFLDFAQDSMILFVLHHFDSSHLKQNLSSKKIYAIDTGLINSISFHYGENQGFLLENIVFNYLHHRHNNLYYFKNSNECDFIIQNGKVCQVCYSMQNEKTKERELDGLKSAMTKFKLDEGFILTWDEEEELHEQNRTIFLYPVWKMMLSETL